ncbi:hypothetical protein MSAN_01338000 [Mycena sanguinolenta]|uniref:Uncharacterized protein n=1 Tax=Mycena sanguinolenta TaxID=230812 RepID=A0A8H6YAI4_9AGAR|nr:hypothetical protein MSAN_01338000 [Mycena sanguinolenta]
MVNWWYQRGTASRRRQVACVALALFVVVLLVLPRARTTVNPSGSSGGSTTNSDNAETTPLKLPGPPSHEVLRKWEEDLPQHNLDLPFPEGRNGRYVKFSNQMVLVGWNNCLNERLMNAHLAYMSKRAYVFTEYIWDPSHYPWPPAQQPTDYARTPLNAIVSGPMAGGSWDPDDPAPRSISERWFDVVCPKERRRLIHVRDVKPALADRPGDEVFAAWQKVLLEAEESCVEVVRPAWGEDDSMPQVFDLWLWGSNRVVPLWDVFKDSPTSRLLGPSPIVRSAIDRNEYLFVPRGPRPAHPAPRDVFARMLAIHLRRGDYIEHCKKLADWGSTFYSWAQLPQVLDQFTPLPGDDPARLDTVLSHCLPTSAQIVKKIRDTREEYVKAGSGRVLDVLYLLTNEHGEWLDELKGELAKAGWHTIVTTRDLKLDPEQEEVSMAVDMQFARQAAVFVGNGVRVSLFFASFVLVLLLALTTGQWSSFTGNIIHQRLVDGREPLSIRLT